MAGRLLSLVVLDSLDSMRPPGFDVMMLVIAALGAVMSTIQPASQSYVLARMVLEPTLFTVALYLALRGASGVAGLVREQIIEVYMAYPISRLGVLAAIVASRVVIPAVMLLALPITIAGILVYPVVVRDPSSYLLVFSGYLVQSLLYGIVFILIAVAAKNTGTASVLSITFYFAYNVVWLIIQSLSAGLGEWAQHLEHGMMFQRVTYFTALERAGLPSTPLSAIDYLMVPATIAAAAAVFTAYFTRRFEPA